MRQSPVDNVRFVRASVQCAQASFDFGNHAAAYDTVFDKRPRLVSFERRNKTFLVLKIFVDAFGIGEEQKFFGFECARNVRRNVIGIDVVAFAVLADADRSNNGNIILTN